MKLPFSPRALALAVSAFSVLAAPMAVHAAVPSGSLIKGTTSNSVYYVEAGKRYAFPNEQVFKSWYADFSAVVTVPDTDLAAFTLSGNVRFRPGTQLIKITTDPKVYALSRFGVLRWIMSEQVAKDLYGADWNTKVRDVPDTFFMNYVRGSDIGQAKDYSAPEETVIARISDDIRPLNFVPPALPTSEPPATSQPTASISVVVSTSQATLNQQVLVFASVVDAVRPISKIDIYSDKQTVPLATCVQSKNCSFTYTVDQAPLTIAFYAKATDDLGAAIDTPVGSRATLYVEQVSSDIQMSLYPYVTTVGSRVSYTSDAAKFQGIASHKVYVAIPGEPNPILWKDCGAESICASSSPFYRTSQVFSKVTVGGQMYQSASVTVSVSGNGIPKPTLTLIAKPSTNQATLRLDAPSGETIGWSTIVAGTSADDKAIALCEFSTCEITVQFSKPQSYTAFTDVGGKLEGSNSLHFEP
ncbi:hypothetical protein HY479_01045 [Candidatus Uhrbacteria bacterium]|nr:hypothetical protein [Candidatus Uhrbacteria bacterium]